MSPETVKIEITQLDWAILGCGEMGTAMATALRSAGVPTHRLLLIQRNPGKRQSLIASGFQARETLEGLSGLDILIIAVKPNDVKAALNQARPYLSPQTWVISVAAGVPYQCLTNWVAIGQPLFRVRPSIFVRQQRGNLLLAPNPNGHDEDFEQLQGLLGSIGNVFVLPENMMEQSTWESSSIPAIIVPKLLQLSVKAAPDEHQEAVVNMMLAGLGSLLAYLKEQESVGISPTETLSELCRTVVTPGGINDAAMQYLEQQDFWQTLTKAKDTYVAAEDNLKRRFE